MRYLLLFALPLAACSINGDSDAKASVRGTGTGSSRTFAVSDFSGVDLRGSDDVDVRVGTGFSVRAEGDAAELDKLAVDKDGDTLRVSRKSGMGFVWNSKHPVRIFVTMPRIATAKVTGSGDMTIDHVEGQDFAAADAGSGNIMIGAATLQAAQLSVSGSGDMKVAGTIARLQANVSGSGDLDAGGVRASSANVSVVGSGSLHAEVDGPAQVSVVGSGDVDLGRKARCTTSKVGSGEVHCGG